MNSAIPKTVASHVSPRLLKSFVDSGELANARRLFDTIPNPDIRQWTVLINGYTKGGFPKESLKLYSQITRDEKLKLDKYVFLPVVKACAITFDLEKAIQVHGDAIKLKLHSDLTLGNALIDMYGKCGFPQGARSVFDGLATKDVISWTSFISACVTSGLSVEALQLFREMCLSGVRPNAVTLSSVLPLCSEMKALKSGKAIHGFAMRNGLEVDLFVCSALVDTYAKCLDIIHARNLFDRMPQRDTVSWNVILAAYFSNGDCRDALKLLERMKVERVNVNSATWNTMIGGCAQNGESVLALRLLSEMQSSGFRANNMTIASVLPAFSNLENLRGGMEINAYCYRHWFMEDVVIVTAMILMYAKCGELDTSRRIFNTMTRKDTVSWNTIIAATSMHGCGEEALSLFHSMLSSGWKPNAVTFMAVLTGCSHSHLVDEGRNIFSSMSTDHGINPDVDHYSCMVDILCRCGHLYDAYDFMQKMPMEPSSGAWGALLAGCRLHKNVELGKIAAHKLFEIEPNNPGNYILLSNIYVTAKLWSDASSVRKLMRDRGIVKEPGCSWIPIRNRIYTFVKGDRRNTDSEKIYEFLKEMVEKMKLAGCLPKTDCVLQDIDDEEKEETLCSHSEKLAVAFGILNNNGKSSVRVFKNLRICEDCHNTIKFMANDTGLLIIVRDSMRFHHFKDGTCSCGDVW